jgi:transcriptional regulator with XRE-family HTH domain
MNALDKAINQLLREKRKSLGTTMLEVARCLNKTHGFIGLIESDKRFLSVGELEVYCNVLCVNIEDVIKEAKDKVMFQFEKNNI